MRVWKWRLWFWWFNVAGGREGNSWWIALNCQEGMQGRMLPCNRRVDENEFCAVCQKTTKAVFFGLIFWGIDFPCKFVTGCTSSQFALQVRRCSDLKGFLWKILMDAYDSPIFLMEILRLWYPFDFFVAFKLVPINHIQQRFWIRLRPTAGSQLSTQQLRESYLSRRKRCICHRWIMKRRGNWCKLQSLKCATPKPAKKTLKHVAPPIWRRLASYP